MKQLRKRKILIVLISVLVLSLIAVWSMHLFY